MALPEVRLFGRLAMSVGQPHWYCSTKRRPFISVYPDSTMLGVYVCAWSPDQRKWRENKIERGVGVRPAYRINVRFHDKGSDYLRRRATAKQIALHDDTVARARAEGLIE